MLPPAKMLVAAFYWTAPAAVERLDQAGLAGFINFVVGRQIRSGRPVRSLRFR